MKILFLDIETSPNKAFVWGLWQEVTKYESIDSDWYILCWAAKWLDSKEVMSSALPDFKDYKKNPEDDRQILLKLWKLLDEADIVIAHNGAQFDRRKINARFIINGIKPPSPYRLIDTLLESRKEFAFTSHKLGDIAKFLGIGEKLDTGGFKLWKECLEGKMESWKKMVSYCKKDILLLEKVYMTLRPYILQHPNVGIENILDKPVCPKCGSSHVQYRGYSFTNLSKFKRFCCNECGGWGRCRINLIEKKDKAILVTNA